MPANRAAVCFDSPSTWTDFASMLKSGAAAPRPLAENVSCEPSTRICAARLPVSSVRSAVNSVNDSEVDAALVTPRKPASVTFAVPAPWSENEP